MVVVTPDRTVLNIEQETDARAVHSFNLAALLPVGDTLSSVTWTAKGSMVLDMAGFDGVETSMRLAGGQPETWCTCTAAWESAPSGARGKLALRVFVTESLDLDDDLGSALFPNRFKIVEQLRADNLLLAAQTYFPGVTLSEDHIWNKLKAAEAEAARTLRVRLQPTAYFPETPTQEQIDALGGMPWAEDPAYDYDPFMFQDERWGFIATRHKPLIEVRGLRFSYPSPNNMVFDIPPEWLKLDKKYGQIRIVPSTVTSVGVMGATMMSMIGGGRTIPHLMQLVYVAGLQNAARDYPDLVDAVKKMAVLKIIEDTFTPQSGSISADGLSQSMSADVGKYHETIDRIFNGADGANGGLMAAIHGIRMAVL